MFDFRIDDDIDLIQYFSMVFDLYIFPTILLTLLVLVKVSIHYDLTSSEMKERHTKFKNGAICMKIQDDSLPKYCLIFSPGPILSILSYHTHNLIDEIFSVTCRL